MANHDVKAVREAVTTSEQFNTRKLYVSHDYWLPFRITSWRNFTVILDKLFTQTETLQQDFFPVAIQITEKKIACAATDSTRYSMTDPLSIYINKFRKAAGLACNASQSILKALRYGDSSSSMYIIFKQVFYSCLCFMAVCVW
jgi:hypothetical protein